MGIEFGKISYVIDKDYKIQYFNDEAKRAFPNIDVGKYCYELVRGESSPCPTCPILTEDPANKIVYTDGNGEKYYSEFINVRLLNGEEGYAVFPDADKVGVNKYEAELSLMSRKVFAYRQANYDFAYMYFEFNATKDLLTTDVFEVVDYVESKVNIEELGVKKPYTYSGFHKWRLKDRVLSKRDEYKNMADCKKLIEAFNSGQTMLELTFRSRSTGGYLTWHHQSVFLFKGDFDNDIHGLYVLRDINRKIETDNKTKQNEEIMKILANEYSAVFYIELETGLVSLCNIPMTFDEEFRSALRTSTYPELWRMYVLKRVHNSDAEFLLKFTDPEYVINMLRAKNSFSYIYRVGDETDFKYFELKLVKGEQGDPKSFVLGIADKDDAIRTQQEQQHQLELALIMAQKDSLTGVRNRTAYDIAESKLNKDVESGAVKEYAIAMFDANGLKKANDMYGHEKGNLLLINTSKLICDTFKHSQVFRIGGDEFLCLLVGEDYQSRDRLMGRIRSVIRKNEEKGDPIYENVSIASGLAVYNPATDKSASNVFEKADKLMYENKARMKARRQKRILY